MSNRIRNERKRGRKAEENKKKSLLHDIYNYKKSRAVSYFTQYQGQECYTISGSRVLVGWFEFLALEKWRTK